MALTSKTWKILSFSEIPQAFTEDHWISEEKPDGYVEVHIGEDEPDDDLTKWILAKYPELRDEDSFLIHMDY